MIVSTEYGVLSNRLVIANTAYGVLRPLVDHAITAAIALVARYRQVYPLVPASTLTDKICCSINMPTRRSIVPRIEWFAIEAQFQLSVDADFAARSCLRAMVRITRFPPGKQSAPTICKFGRVDATPVSAAYRANGSDGARKRRVGASTAIIGSFFILGFVVAPFLPETNGRPLPGAA